MQSNCLFKGGNVRGENQEQKEGQQIYRLLTHFKNCRAQMPNESVLGFINKRREGKSVFSKTETIVDRTVRLDFNVLKKILKLAKGVRLIAQNPAVDVEDIIEWGSSKPSTRENSRKYLDSLIVRKIVAAAVRYMRGHETWAFWIALMAYTGNRPAQIFRLRLDDFEPVDNAVARR